LAFQIVDGGFAIDSDNELVTRQCAYSNGKLLLVFGGGTWLASGVQGGRSECATDRLGLRFGRHDAVWNVVLAIGNFKSIHAHARYKSCD
jgi:hypothetical protein